MMLTISEDRRQIRVAHDKFRKAMYAEVSRRIKAKPGYQGASFDASVSWSDSLGVWMLMSTVPNENRYWNAFGVEKPATKGGASITCEINPTKAGIYRNIAGAFALDKNGRTYLVHRGKIGGGREGIGKTLFENNYRGTWVWALDGNRETKFALIGALDSERLAYQVAAFVHEVDRIKHLVTKSRFTNSGHKRQKSFVDEFAGEIIYERGDVVKASADHGIIVNALAQLFEERGWAVSNDRYRDLVVIDKKRKRTIVFEIKTDIGRQSVYTGVGQLLLNNRQSPPRPELILLLPHSLRRQTIAHLRSLGIEQRVYSWRGEKPVFHSVRDSIVKQ